MIKAIFFDFYGVINIDGQVNREIVEFLQTNNDKYLFGILSAANIDLHDWLITHGINDYFALVQTTRKVGLSKSDPEFYKTALDLLSVKPKEAVFVDDLKEYIEIAKKLHIRALHYKLNRNFIEQLQNFQ